MFCNHLAEKSQVTLLMCLLLIAGTVQCALIQHLDATVSGSVTGNPVTQWTDQSGSGNDATSAVGSVTYPSGSRSESGLAGLDFGTDRNTLQLFDAVASDSWLGQSSGSGFAVLVAFKVDSVTGDWNDLIGNSSSVASGFGMRYSNSGLIQAYLGGVTINKTGESVSVGDTIVYAFNYNASTDTYEFWDSKNDSSRTGSFAATDFSLSKAVTLGSTTNGGRYFDGMVGEIKIYDAALGASQFQSERDGLVQKWVVPSSGGDVDGDGDVDTDDLTMFANAWLDFDCDSDANFDQRCTIDLRDFLILSSNWMTDNVITGGDLDYGAYYGYQAWHLAPDTGSGSFFDDWVHWFDNNTPTAAKIHGDMWPDMSEYPVEDLFDTQMLYPNGDTAKLYSCSKYSTVDLHIKWMKDYGLKGHFYQVQCANITDPDKLAGVDVITEHIITACEKYEVKFCMMPCNNAKSDDQNENIVSKITDFWKHCVDDLKVTESPQYMYQNGLPVIGLWGLGFDNRPMTVAEATEILDFFQNSPQEKYRVYVMGGVPSSWRTSPKAGWSPVFLRLDMVSPWRTIFNPITSNIERMNEDLAYCNANGLDYNPVVSPGASTLHLRDSSEMFNWKPRYGGHFLWEQVYEVCKMGSKFMYVAMFDEVDEGTAMYKLAETQADCPVDAEQAPLNIDGYNLPSDWYLRVGREAQKMLDGRIGLTPVLPIDPENP